MSFSTLRLKVILRLRLQHHRSRAIRRARAAVEPMTPPAMVPAGVEGFGGDEDEEEEEEEGSVFDAVGLGLLLLDVELTFGVRVVALVARLEDVAETRFTVTVVAADETVVVEVDSESETGRNPNAISEVDALAGLVGERESDSVGRELGC